MPSGRSDAARRAASRQAAARDTAREQQSEEARTRTTITYSTRSSANRPASARQTSGDRSSDPSRTVPLRTSETREPSSERSSRTDQQGTHSRTTTSSLMEEIERQERRQRATIAIVVAAIVVILAVVLIVRGCAASSSSDEEEAAEEETTTESVETTESETDSEESAVDSDSETDTSTSTSTTASATSITGSTVEERLAACDDWEAQSALDFSSIVDTGGIVAFNLSAGDDATSTDDLPQLSIANIVALAEALAPYEEAEVPYGFLIMDLETGRGFACNLDEEVYGASSFKAAFCTYIAMSYLDTGTYSLSSTLGEISIAGADGTSYSSSATLYELFQSTIIYSSNEAFMALRGTFSDDELAAWLEDLGIDGDIAYDTSFPHYTTRDAARLWLTIYQYFDEDTEAASLIEECCSSTETSFLRSALSDLDGVTVRDKAGWYADEDSSDGIDYNAICDNGIVTYNGRDYLVCVMLGASYSDTTVEHAETLMSAIFALYEDLA